MQLTLADYQSIDAEIGEQNAPLTEERLRRLYEDELLSQAEIGRRYGVSQNKVGRRMRELGIETRGHGGAKTLKALREPAGFYTCKTRGYEYGFGIRNEEIEIHRLMAVAEHGFEAVVGNDVHHGRARGDLPACEIPWANWPGNLELLSRSDHMSHHHPLALSPEEVERIREMHGSGEWSENELADVFEVSPATTHNAITGKRGYEDVGTR